MKIKMNENAKKLNYTTSKTADIPFQYEPCRFHLQGILREPMLPYYDNKDNIYKKQHMRNNCTNHAHCRILFAVLIYCFDEEILAHLFPHEDHWNYFENSYPALQYYCDIDLVQNTLARVTVLSLNFGDSHP